MSDCTCPEKPSTWNCPLWPGLPMTAHLRSLCAGNGRESLAFACAAKAGRHGPPGALPPTVRTAEQSSGPPSHPLVAPLGSAGRLKPYEGRLTRKKWDYPATVVIPHLDTPEELAIAVELLRRQTVPLYLLVIDTGSGPAACERLEQLRGEDCEVHYLRSHGWQHPSQPVAAALDAAMGDLCQTERMLLTHADLFVRRRDSVAWLLDQCSERVPVVGWEMSDRSFVTEGWRGLVSHTFTALWMPLMRRIRPTWSLTAWSAEHPHEVRGVGWPDTETQFNCCLKAAGITPVLLGPEFNYERQQTDWWDHARSYPSWKLYVPGPSKVSSYMTEALADARARLDQWDAADLHGRRLPW